MRTFRASGDSNFIYVEIDSDALPVGYMTIHIEVAPASPYLLAALFDPKTGLLLAVSGTKITLTAPDGTIYDQSANTAQLFAKSSASGPVAFCVPQPVAGQWSLTCQSLTSVKYRAVAFVPAISQPVTSALQALTLYFPQQPDMSAPNYQYQLFRWAYLGFAALSDAMHATTGLAIDLNALIKGTLGLTSAQVQQIVAALGAVSVSGVALQIAQVLRMANAETAQQLIKNGDGSQQLAGWTIIAGGGQGWSVQSGYSSRIQYATNFSVSNGWCKKSQSMDLVADHGLSPGFLDQAPVISIKDWISASYPPSSATPSSYYLIVELRDAAGNALKRFQTGILSVPAMRWLAVNCVFSDYGPGARSIYFEHGGTDAGLYPASNGLKITGASVEIALGIPANPPRELITNGSATAGLSGWTQSGDVPWQVETGPGVNCPGSRGTNAFAAGSGAAAKKGQLIDLLASGYSASFLDASPVVQASDWICAEPNCTCTYSFTIELRDAQQNVLQSYATGPITVTPAPGGVAGFTQFAQTMTDYPAGLRYIHFEDSASSGMPGMTAKVTGSSVKFLTPVDPAMGAEPRLREAAAADTVPTPIANTLAYPYVWICWLKIYFNDPNNSGYSCSGWLIDQPSPNNFFVVSAAHCIRSRELAWPRKILIQPAQGNSGRQPYEEASVTRGRLHVPIEWLVANQCQSTKWTLFDYGGMFVTSGPNWDRGGFTLTVETDQQLRNQAATITGFPARAPYTSGKMYTESVSLSPYGPSQVSVPTYFTNGASGCPIYVGAAGAISIESYGDSLSLFSDGTTRINDKVKERIKSWTQPLTPDTRITKLQMVIRTGTDWGAGTDDDITCTIDDSLYELESLWFGGAGLFRSRNEPGDFDGYDLTPRLNEIYPTGITVGTLITKSYTIKRVIPFLMYHSLANGDWQVESVAFWVNDQLLCASNFFRWINYPPLDAGSITGHFSLH